MIACLPEIGGAKAVDWIGRQVQQLFEHRAINPPAQIWQVLGEDSDHTARRVAVAQATGRERVTHLRVK